MLTRESRGRWCQTAYLQLRCLVDRGCRFVGHGLAKDFRVLNMIVPDDQVRQRLLWWLPGEMPGKGGRACVASTHTELPNVVSAHQVVDTVKLFQLPNNQYLSLRFLASHLLDMDIQVCVPTRRTLVARRARTHGAHSPRARHTRPRALSGHHP